MPPKKATTVPPPTVERVEDLEGLTVPQLKDFLRPRGVRLGGNRAELLQLARLYFRFEKLSVAKFSVWQALSHGVSYL